MQKCKIYVSGGFSIYCLLLKFVPVLLKIDHFAHAKLHQFRLPFLYHETDSATRKREEIG